MAQQELVQSARRIARQIEARLDGHSASGDAFVVSVYGEWGIGKTRCLKDVERYFGVALGETVAGLKSDAAATFVVPVFFDPWQYEHEEHLVVPLLKTIELRLRRLAKEIEESCPVSKGEHLAQTAAAVGTSVKKAGGVLGDLAVALLSGIKFKFAPLKEVFGIEFDVSPADMFDAARKAAEQRPADEAAAAFHPAAKHAPNTGDLTKWLSERESLYFDVHRHLRQLTQGQPALRFVVLIDDLDRCLPEKAIQVLESVKLFLNVPGFSFVLAVDDEVVERGIAHRYSPYLQAGAGRSEGLPITGAEYLEKVVHLPVHLQRWTQDEAERFLRVQYPKLFAQPERKEQSSAGFRRDDAAETRLLDRDQGNPQAEALLRLVAAAVPLVPRKLIRLAEALEYMEAHFRDLGAAAYWHPLHAARVVAVQQLYPALYRHLRLRNERYWRLFGLELNDYGEPAVRGGPALHQLREQFDKRAAGVSTPAATTELGEQPAEKKESRAERDTLREQLDLLRIVYDAGQQRGAPNPLKLFDIAAGNPENRPESIGQGCGYEAFARLYIHGLALAAAPTAAPPRSDDRIAEVADAQALVDTLLLADAVSRRAGIEAARLSGRLPDAVFAGLLAGAKERPGLATDIEWLKDIAALLSAGQLLELYVGLQVIDRLAALRGERA